MNAAGYLPVDIIWKDGEVSEAKAENFAIPSARWVLFVTNKS